MPKCYKMASCLDGGATILAIRQTLGNREAIVYMAQIRKEDCLTIEEAKDYLGFSKASLYNYMNALGIQRHKFPFDRRTYVLRTDVERIKRFVEGNRS
jgi:hypothetical protein